MEEKFKIYLIHKGLKGAPNSYPKAINLISEHFSSHTGKHLDIYSLKDEVLLKSIVQDYSQTGRFSKFGYDQHGRFRAAIQSYYEFFKNLNFNNSKAGIVKDLEDLPKDSLEEIENISSNLLEERIISSFTYEKDLQKSLCLDIENLFPDYKIFGINNEGIEYAINGKRIDVLLKNKINGDLLAIELKSGVADFKVFGQISMYIGLLKSKFPNNKIKGLIIAGTIDETLSFACSTTDIVSLKTYKMKLQLEDYMAIY